MSSETFAVDVDRVLAEIGDMLKAKNAAYGNSALDPLRIFSRAETVEQLNVRIDDKLSRIKRGKLFGGPSDAHCASGLAAEDVDLDLIGYLVLRRIAKGRRTSAEWMSPEIIESQLGTIDEALERLAPEEKERQQKVAAQQFVGRSNLWRHLP